MGGNSSKAKKSKTGNKYELSHSLDGGGSGNPADVAINNNTSGRDRHSVKKKNRSEKGSVKIKADKKKRSKSFRTNDAKSDLDPVLIADISEIGDKKLLPNSPVYRKKSSCPSCEAKEILLGKNRSRSSSEMRFSDFNKVLRRTRIYEWEMAPMDIPLYGPPEPQPDDICYICGVYTGSLVRACRVCSRAYHDGCLSKIGHALSEKSRRLVASNQWSCHQCSALNHLLTQEEVRVVLDDLQDLGINKDNITQADYLKYCQHSLQQEDRQFTEQKKENSTSRFQSMTDSHTGVVTWAHFLNIESIRILNRRCKDSLVRLLTKAEISEARKIFQKLDNNQTGMTTKSAVLALLDSDKIRGSAYYPDDSMMYIDEDSDSPLTWGDFLRDRAIYFLGLRPNLEADSVSRAESLDDDIGGANFTRSSIDSIDDDDYNTCHSDLEGVNTIERPDSTKPKTSAPNANLDDSSEGQLSPLNTNILEEFNSEMDKCCIRHNASNSDVKEIPGPNSSNGKDLNDEKCSSKNVQKSECDCKDQVSSKDQVSPDGTQSQTQKSIPSESITSTTNSKAENRTSKDSRSTPERNRSSPLNDTRHTTTPGDDHADKPLQRIPAGIRENHIGYRRSDVIPRRQTHEGKGQARAVSQTGCRQGKGVLAPAFGNLVGRVNNGEWGC